MKIRVGALRRLLRETLLGDPQVDDFKPVTPERASSAFPSAFIEWDEEMGPIDRAKFFIHVEGAPTLLAELEDGSSVVWDPQGKAWDFM